MSITDGFWKFPRRSWISRYDSGGDSGDSYNFNSLKNSGTNGFNGSLISNYKGEGMSILDLKDV